MKKIFTLFLATVFLFQSCDSKTEKKETTLTIDTITTSLKEEQSISNGKKVDLPFDIEGKYVFEENITDCKVELTLFYQNGNLQYQMKTKTRTVSDNAEISEENVSYYITFKNIKWSENLGFIDPEGNTPEKKLPLPTEIMAGLKENEIIFQNYGNAENYFMILKECDVKYIELVKQTNVELGEDIAEMNAYAKNIYQKNGKIYIDLDLVEIKYPTEGEWDVSDREIVNNNPKIRTYIIDNNTSILSNVCEELNALQLLEAKKSALKNQSIIVIAQSKNGKLSTINFGCYG